MSIKNYVSVESNSEVLNLICPRDVYSYYFICRVLAVELLLKIIATVLLIFILSLQLLNQVKLKAICLCRTTIAYLEFRFFVWNMGSSANKAKLLMLILGMQLVYTRYRYEKRQEPCGTFCVRNGESVMYLESVRAADCVCALIHDDYQLFFVCRSSVHCRLIHMLDNSL